MFWIILFLSVVHIILSIFLFQNSDCLFRKNKLAIVYSTYFLTEYVRQNLYHIFCFRAFAEGRAELL